MQRIPFYFFACLLAIFVLPACTFFETEDDNGGGLELPSVDHYILLQVDYETLDFEGGKVSVSAVDLPEVDSLPVYFEYHSPGDFGDYGLYSSFDSSTLFFGTIVWAGTGERSFPETLDEPVTFKTTNDIPEILPLLQDLNPVEYTEVVDPADLWAAVSQLDILVDAVLTEGARFGWFLYPRSVGVGNPVEWDYYVVAYVPE